MIKFLVSNQAVLDQKTEGLVFFLQEDFSFDKELTKLSQLFFTHLKKFMKDKKFSGKSGQTLYVAGSDKVGIKHLFFLGLGKKPKGVPFDVEDYRRIMSTAVRMAETNKVASIAVEQPDAKLFGQTTQFMTQKTTTISMLTEYAFDEFLTNKNAKPFQVKEIVIVVPAKDNKVVKEGIRIGQIVGHAVNRARNWVDLPSNQLSPVELAKRAKQLCTKHGLDVKVFGESQIEKMGMGGLKAVGMGSQHDAQLVVMQYKVKAKNAPTLALVGKGITFDSGGYNLKPTGYLESMKQDMTGAAAVINAMVAISDLKPNVNVVGVTALAENMISGNANRPGDIIKFYNGKTAVVGNTDAEGRLVLADALSYAAKNFKPTAMIDVATLTGAVSHAIGPFYSGVLTQDDKLAERVKKAGLSSGDATWRLPLTDRYKKMVESDIADICNDGKTKYYAGSSNGACFLSYFVGDIPWVHIDIASTAFEVPDTPYYRTGATGSGTRLLIDFVMQWK